MLALLKSKKIIIIVLLILAISIIIFSFIKNETALTVLYHWWMVSIFKDYSDNHMFPLAYYGDIALPYVIKGTESKNQRLKEYSFEILSKMTGFETTEATRKHLLSFMLNILKNDINSADRMFAAISIEAIKREKAIEDLHPYLYDKSDMLKDGIALILAKYHQVEVIPQLIEILQVGLWLDKDALDKIGDRAKYVYLTLIDKPGNKLQGCTYSHTIERAHNLLFVLLGTSVSYNPNESLTKKEQAISKLEEWWQENNDYLYWSDKENHFVVNEEAKKAGIPTEEYRKTHPWPKENGK